jgi:thioester reductase-like protein
VPHDRVLLTGFPGFIATRLVRRLLADDATVEITALVEARMAPRARELAASLDANRLAVVEGDISRPRLGLDAATYERLAQETTVVHHLAAIYDLAVPEALAERVNVEGTQHVVDFCRAAPNLRRHHYVSTAYVAGWRSGLVLETELAAGQTWKNHYESTKFAAEVIVRGSMDDVPTTIYRPAIVVGDSQTGETQKFDGPYYALRLIALCAKLHAPIPQVGPARAPFNVVPVDFIVDAIATVSGSDGAEGACLHLVDPEPPTAAEMTQLMAEAYAGRPVAYRLPEALVEKSLRIGPLRTLFGGTPPESLPYLHHPVRFDTTVASEVLGAHGLTVPRFADYVGPMVAFFREHEDTM